MKHCSNERLLIALVIINNVEPKYKKLWSLIQLLFENATTLSPLLCRTHLILPVWSPLYYSEHILFYQYGHPCIMQNTSCSTRMVTPVIVLCRTRFILPVWLPCTMQNTSCSTSMVTPVIVLCRTHFILPVWSPLYYAEHVLFYQYGYPELCRTRISTS